jgi:hypothetical protein
LFAIGALPTFVEKPKMKGRKTLAEAAAMVERRQSSGLTVHSFCEAEKINVANYYYWHQRLRLKENEQTPMLVPISFEKAGQQLESNRENLELTYPNGVRISVPGNSELKLIRELILIL